MTKITGGTVLMVLKLVSDDRKNRPHGLLSYILEERIF
jgi:hypothetical protein